MGCFSFINSTHKHSINGFDRPIELSILPSLHRQRLTAAADNQLINCIVHPRLVSSILCALLCCTSNPFQVIYTLQVAAAYNYKCNPCSKPTGTSIYRQLHSFYSTSWLSGLQSESPHPPLPIQVGTPSLLHGIHHLSPSTVSRRASSSSCTSHTSSRYLIHLVLTKTVL